MPRGYFEYTIEKALSFQRQIGELLAGDFPIPATMKVLRSIDAVFKTALDRLRSVANDSEVVQKAASAHTNLQIRRFLPALGFILRSTNVRNSFELSDPLTRLAKQILKKELVFVLSSEWDFSPLTYTFSFKELPDVIFLGLPSFESANSLVVPLAGHELGHWIWRHQDIDGQLQSVVQDNVLNSFRDNWNSYRHIFGPKDADVGTIQTDTRIASAWTVSFADSMRQCEEVFADIIGLRLFGEGYLHSFEYLIAPFTGEVRSRQYPEMRTRAGFLRSAATRLSIPCPSDYAERFDDASGASDAADEFLLEASDQATGETAEEIIRLVQSISTDGHYPAISPQASEKCLSRVRIGMPAEGIEYIGDIVNAGWAAYLDNSIFPAERLKGRRKIDVLNEILLKSIEVMEISYRLGEHNASND